MMNFGKEITFSIEYASTLRGLKTKILEIKYNVEKVEKIKLEEKK